MGKEIVSELVNTLKNFTALEFAYKSLFSEVFENVEGCKMINVYTSSQKDEMAVVLMKIVFMVIVYWYCN